MTGLTLMDNDHGTKDRPWGVEALTTWTADSTLWAGCPFLAAFTLPQGWWRRRRPSRGFLPLS